MALTQISTAGVKDDAVTAGKIPANAVGTSEIAADAVTGAQIADDAINSEHYTDGSIDTAHIADDAVTADKLANAINTDIAAKAVLTGSTNNTVATVTGANAIAGEANLTFDGSKLAVTGDVDVTDGAAVVTIKSTNAQTAGELHFDGDAVTSADYWLGNIGGRWNGNDVAAIRLEAGNDTTNKDDGLLTFHTSDASSAPDERMRIDNHGRVIKGHTSTVNTWGAGARSQVHGLIWEDSSRSQTRWANDTGSSTFMLCKSRSGTPGSFTAVQDDDNIGNIGWLGDDGTDLAESVARIDCYVDGTVASNQIPGRLEFSTTKSNGQSSNKMTIDASGDVTIHSGTLSINHSDGISVYGSIAMLETTNYGWIHSYSGKGIYARPTTNGAYMDSGATSWSSGSDERTKTGLTPITDALTKINGCRSVIGRYKTDEESKKRSFLIAQDFQTHFPEAVSVDPEKESDENLGLRYQDVIPLLLAGIKELSAEVETLKTEVAALKAG